MKSVEIFVGGLPENLKDILELVSLRRDQEHTCSCTFKVQ